MSELGRYASEGKFFRTIWKLFKKKIDWCWRMADRLVGNCYNKVKFYNKPIDPYKITMVTSRGTYNCNPRAVADEIRKRKLPYKIIWVNREENVRQGETYPSNIKTVFRDSYEFHQEAATSKVWIDNSVTFSYMFAKKRKEQVLIETWHGTFGLKKFDASINNNKYWVKKAYEEGKQTDFILTNCKFEEELFHSTFWPNAECLKYGHPRNDLLFENKRETAEKVIKKIRKIYHLSEDTKVLLYAPTYRDDKNAPNYEFNYEEVLEALEDRFGGNWVIMVRYHFMDRKLKTLDVSNPKIINVTNYSDIQDLMLVTDIGVTDYSSWIYDYFFTKKPGLLYTPDLQAYVEKDREFLFPLEDTPFPIAETMDEFCENIRSFDEKKYADDYKSFSEQMDCYEDGHAAERLVDKLEEIMGR